MKLKTRLVIAFMSIIIIPIVLLVFSGILFFQYEVHVLKKAYGVNVSYEMFTGTSIKVLTQLTNQQFQAMDEQIDEDSAQFLDMEYLDGINTSLEKSRSYLIVRVDDVLYYNGADEDNIVVDFTDLPNFEVQDGNIRDTVYDYENGFLSRQLDFVLPTGGQVSVFIITEVVDMMPETRDIAIQLILGVVLILAITAATLTVWIYRAMVSPLNRLKEATHNIKEGNLNFELKPENKDEIGELCEDFEDMRRRLKESAEERLSYDNDNKELISNISHDLKTPITAIKGYVEGIMDGVADTPEKINKYVRTIYNKANDMDRLIDELTYYSKIDTNRIPYVFSKINVSEFFGDCADEVSLDLEAKGIDFGYYNYVDEGTVIIADAEQLHKVINNIISNSVKYMDKPKGHINIRIKDDGDFIHVEMEDNGKGIGVKDLPYIFDRFYRTDSSRNSQKGGSGIGLSIVKKIIEDHGGSIWATSKEGTGTEMHFVLRKYQEVVNHGENIDH